VRQIVSGRQQQEYDAMSRVRLRTALMDALSKLADFPVPPSIADGEFNQIWQEFEKARAAGTQDEEDKTKDEDTLRADYRAIAERRVRLGLLLAEIGRVNNITVTEMEFERALYQRAAQYPGQEAQMMEFMRKYPQISNSIRGPLLEEKVVDFVLELARVTDVVVTPEELAKDPAEAPTEAAGNVQADVSGDVSGQAAVTAEA
jgi:trigger factor